MSIAKTYRLLNRATLYRIINTETRKRSRKRRRVENVQVFHS